MGLRSLVMGFGGSGSYILTAIKQIAVIKHGKKPEEMQFLEFDTLAPEVFSPSKYIEGDQDINEDFLIDEYSEYYYLRDQKPNFSQHIDRHVAHPVDDQYEIFENWLHSEWMGEHLAEKHQNIRTGASQHRQIGRYAAFRNAEDIRDRIKEKLIQAANGDALVPVWLVGSAAGGTGAGTMIDAAFITRAASQIASVKIELAGVVVLPSVYDDVPGIDEARVHSFFRELERFQTATGDKFLHDGTKIASFVEYRNFRSNVSSELFDNLIYVGQQCTEAQRRGFFTSVGNAIEPYLDAQAGTDLLEATANDTRAYSSFGATRLYVPEETYADLFAQEQLRDYLDAVVPSAERGEGVEAGDPGARESAATDRVKDLLNFKDLLEDEGWSYRRYRQFVKTLSPETIVTGWCQFNNITSSRERQISARLAYSNPLYSLTEPEPNKVDDEDIRLQTYSELRNAGGEETQENSRDRFYEKLGRLKDTYTSAEGGPKTFKSGRREFRDGVLDYLIGEIDEDIIGDLSGSATDPNAPGTPLTRLYEELKHVIAQEGPLATIDGVLENMIEVAEEGASNAEKEYNDEREFLNNASPTGILGSWGTWVDVPQEEARDAATDYFDWYQKRELLKVLREVVREVRERYQAWHAQVKAVVDALALGERPVKYVTDDQIRSLEGRLYRMTQQGTAMISLEGGDDVSMQGYRDKLRDTAVVDQEGNSLASRTLTASKWEASVEEGRPVLTLAVGDDTIARSTEASQSLTREFRRALLGAFRDRIDDRLANRDVFDYLKHVVENKNFDPGDVAARLEEMSEPLLEGGGTTEFLFVHTSLADSEKARLAGEIRDEFNQDAKRLEHSDENALTLVQVKKPGPDDVTPELKNYEDSYISRINQGPQGGEAFTRAQVYHPFRPELEAWFIERHFQHEEPKGASNYYLPPRIVRLLEYPRMMKHFVYCLAANAIEGTENQMGENVWVWHNTERDMECNLTDPAVEGHDLIQAATTFVLRQQPLNYIVDIDADTALQSAWTKAEEQGHSLGEMVKGFAQADTIREFIAEHIDDEKTSVEERKGLARVFQFYSQQWGERHGLQNRTL